MTGNATATYDVIIVGAGPAGATAALYARRHGLKTLLLDKACFPRDKICGDALSGKAVGILRDLDLLDEVRQLPGASIRTIVFGSPKHIEAHIDLNRSSRTEFMTGFVIRRELFDDFLFHKARQVATACVQGFTVERLVMDAGRVCGVQGHQAGHPELMTFKGNLVLGADGYKSVVARRTGVYTVDLRHWIVALRCYYQEVAGLTDQIELHYVGDVLPGYFWLFPLEPGYANIGIGMLCSAMRWRGVNLRQALRAVLQSPYFRQRFRSAKALEPPVGWNLPLGSKPRTNHGDGFMLLGDAAGLIDPFTGEGIGNAMFSARYAIETARAAHEAQDFSAAFLARYHQQLWAAIGDELRVSSRLQQLGQWRPLLNFTIGKAAQRLAVRDLICGMIANEILRQRLANPLFYLKLLCGS